MQHRQDRSAYWKRSLFTLLLLAPRAVGIVSFIIAVMAVTGLAYAGPTCPRVISQTEEGTTVLIGEGCELGSVARKFPLAGPDGKALPLQVQMRSIYAANQNRIEPDGSLRRRTVLRTCAKPGKPDPYADTEEKTLCPNGLMYYFGVASDGSQARIFIPSKRVLTVAESAEAAERQEAAKQAERDALQARTLADNEAKEIELMDAAAAARIAELEAQLAESRHLNASLKAPASKGRWFWRMVICMVGLVAWGVGGTLSTIRARQVRPVIATGRFFASDEVASNVLSEENLSLKLENDQLRRGLRQVRKQQAEEHRTFTARISSLETSVSERSLLSTTRLTERDDARRQRDVALEEQVRLQDAAVAIRQESDLKEREIEGLRSEKNGLMILNEMIETENTQLKSQVRQLTHNQSQNEFLRLTAEAKELEGVVSSLQDVQKGQAKQLIELSADLETERAHSVQLEAEKIALSDERSAALKSYVDAQARLDSLEKRAAMGLQGAQSDRPQPAEALARVRKNTVPFGVSALAPSSVNSQDAPASSGIQVGVGLSPSSSGTRTQTVTGLASVQNEEQPEERFVALYDEIRTLRTERNVYAQGVRSIRTVVFGENLPEVLVQLKPEELIRLLVQDIVEVYRKSGRSPDRLDLTLVR